MAKRTNRIIAEDSQIADDEDVFAEIEAQDEENREEEVDETSVLDADDMYETERVAPRPGKDKTGKGKGVKTASKSAKDEEWRPANTLDAPTPRPGMVQRWIRHLSPGSESGNDAKNWSRAMREGWRPRALDTIPEGFDPPTARHGSYGTVVSVGDVILCEMPVERFKSRRKFFRAKLARQLAAITKRPLTVAESLNGPRIEVENKKDLSFGRRRRAAATDED